MHFLFTIACLLLTFHVNGLQTLSDDDVTHFKCQKGKFYYPDPEDVHKFIQCDEFGKAFSKTCPSPLVWDQSITTCNWPPSDEDASPTDDDSTEATTSESDSSSTDAPSDTLCDPNPCKNDGKCIQSAPTDSSPDGEFACICSENYYGRLCENEIDELTTPSSSTTPEPSSTSLCQPNPCKNGRCIESCATDSNSSPDFACICSENWFGRLCEEQVDDLTTPSSAKKGSDQNENESETHHNSPSSAKKGSDQNENQSETRHRSSSSVHKPLSWKYTVTGSKDKRTVRRNNGLQKRTMNLNLQKENEVLFSAKETNLTNNGFNTSVKATS